MNASFYLILLIVPCSFVFSQDGEATDGLSRDDHQTESRKSITKRESVKKTDLSYPGCGLRFPNIEESESPSSKIEGGDRRKRSNSHVLSFFSRDKREILPNIAGGVDVERFTWPWMGQLFKRIPPFITCGASLISEKYVLTAAHCFMHEKGNVNSSIFYVVVGAYIRNYGDMYPVKKIVFHPEYKLGELKYDIAILAVSNPIKFSKKVYPVCLPPDRLIDQIERDNKNVTVTGWGDTSYGGTFADTLQEITIPIIPYEECNATYSKLGSKNGLWEGFLCAGGTEEGQGVCMGDSGSPLVSELDERYFQIGIVSFAVECGLRGYPAGFTKVSMVKKFIYDNTDLKKV